MFFSKKQSNRKAIHEINNVSFEKQIAFIHIPKNAGTSVQSNIGLTGSTHITVNELLQKLGKDNFESLFSFSFVRNPFSRFVSLYNYARMDESYYHSALNPEKAIYGKHMDYDTLKHASITEAAYLLSEGKLIHNPPHCQWNPQVFWLKDSNDQIKVKYIGRVEDIEFHLQNICRIAGINFNDGLQRINASSSHPIDYRSLIDDETRKILSEYYEEDLEMFNYSF